MVWVLRVDWVSVTPSQDHSYLLNTPLRGMAAAQFFDFRDLSLVGAPHWQDCPDAVNAVNDGTSGEERLKVENILRQIDFANGDVHHFLQHLAGAMAMRI